MGARDHIFTQLHRKKLAHSRSFLIERILEGAFCSWSPIRVRRSLIDLNETPSPFLTCRRSRFPCRTCQRSPIRFPCLTCLRIRIPCQTCPPVPVLGCTSSVPSRGPMAQARQALHPCQTCRCCPCQTCPRAQARARAIQTPSRRCPSRPVR